MATSAQSPLPSVRLTAHPERHRVRPVLLPHLHRLHPELRRIGHGVLETGARGTLGKFAQELTGADRRLQLILPVSIACIQNCAGLAMAFSRPVPEPPWVNLPKN